MVPKRYVFVHLATPASQAAIVVTRMTFTSFTLLLEIFRIQALILWDQNIATLRENPGLKVKLLVGPTCKIPRSTQRSVQGIRRSPKMCQEKNQENCIPKRGKHWSNGNNTLMNIPLNPRCFIGILIQWLMK